MTIGSDGGTGPEITMNSGSLLSANNIEMNGGTITMSGGSQNYSSGTDTALIYLSVGDNRVANFNDGEIKVTGNGGIFGPELNFKGTDVTINEDGNLILGKITVFNQDSDSKTSVITFNEGKLKNIGTITFDADNIALSEDNFAGLLAKEDNNKGTVNFSGSKVNLTVDGDADLLGLGVFGDSGALSANFNVSATELNLKAAGEVTFDSHFKTDKLTIDAKELKAKTAKYDKVANNDYAFAIDQGTISVSDRVTLLEGSGLTAEDAPDHRIYVIAKDKGTTAVLNLVNDGSTQGQLNNVDRVYVGLYATSHQASGTSTLKVDGNWDFGGARLVADTSGTATLSGTVSNVGELVINRAGKIEIASNANVTATRLLGSESGASGSIDINGMLTFKGDGSTETKNEKGEYANDISLTSTNININNGGTLAITGADAVEDIFNVTSGTSGITIDVATSGGKTSEKGGWNKDKVTLNAGGTLKIDLAAVSSELTAIGSENLATIKTDLVNEGYKGAFDFGGIKINLSPALNEDIKDGSVSYDNLVSGGVNDVQNVDGMAGVTVEVSSSNASKGINLGNGAAAIELTGTNSVTVDGSLILKNNGTEDGYFVYTAPAQEGGKQSAADINVATNSGVNFTGAGRMGSITSTGTGTSATLTAGTGAQQTVEGEIDLETVTIGTGTVNVAEHVTATTLTLSGNLNNASESGTNTITAETLTQSADTTLTTNELVLGANDTGTDSALNGVVNATTITMNKATTDNNTLTIAGGVVTSETFEGASGAIINVGTDGSAQTAGAAGTLITNTMDLNGADLVIDPDWNSATGLSFASAKSFSDTSSTKYDAGVLTGNAYTLRNSILAVGVDKLGSDASYQNAKHEVTQLFAQYIDAKAL